MHTQAENKIIVNYLSKKLSFWLKYKKYWILQLNSIHSTEGQNTEKVQVTIRLMEIKDILDK